MPRFSQLALLAVVAASTAVVSDAFAVVPRATAATSLQIPSRSLNVLSLSDESKESAEAAVFMPAADAANADADDEDNEVDLDTVEGLGRGAAKAKRGKRKSGTSATKSTGAQPQKKLLPEETFYEGPPAITETIAPTLSILTVVGIIPAAAAWARQAWVRYRITTRRIRVTSGIGGKDMAEIVYPDIIEIRTARRVFGDGDLVAFLRDGAKFEMRNIPNFQESMDFILKQVDPEVAEAYRSKGDVTKG